MSTEAVLRDWRFGSSEAERLAASILRLEGYVDVDPQHPLGGPDGGRDIICRRFGVQYAAAVHFPPTTQSAAQLRTKFSSDLERVRQYPDMRGFVFISNQYVSVSEREALREIAGAQYRVDIFHLERIRLILDSPDGAGYRLQYLRIPMTDAEQWAFWNTKNHEIVEEVREHAARQLDALARLERRLVAVDQRTATISQDLQAVTSSLDSFAVRSGPLVEGSPTTKLDASILCWLHRTLLASSQLPAAALGVFRTVDVWIGPLGSSHDSATFVPPAPETIPSLIEEWLQKWAITHAQVASSNPEVSVSAIARFFYEFLSIHPFLDGNGRLGLNLLDQACSELLGVRISPDFTQDRAAFYSALHCANNGDFVPLELRIKAAAL